MSSDFVERRTFVTDLVSSLEQNESLGSAEASLKEEEFRCGNRGQLPEEQATENSNRFNITTDITNITIMRTLSTVNLDLRFAMATTDYQRLADGSTSFPDGIYEASDGSYFYNDAVCVHVFEDQLSNPSDCPLCQFFRSMRVQPERYQQHKLLAFRSSDSWLFRPDLLRKRRVYKKYKDKVFMAVVPHVDSIPLCGHLENWLTYDIPATGAIYHLQSDDTQDRAQKTPLLEARELGDKANLDGVREWLDLCRSSHGKACMRRASHEPISHYFRLINCVKEPPAGENPPVED